MLTGVAATRGHAGKTAAWRWQTPCGITGRPATSAAIASVLGRRSLGAGGRRQAATAAAAASGGTRRLARKRHCWREPLLLVAGISMPATACLLARQCVNPQRDMASSVCQRISTDGAAGVAYRRSWHRRVTCRRQKASLFGGATTHGAFGTIAVRHLRGRRNGWWRAYVRRLSSL